MEETPESLPPDDGGADPPAPYGPGDKVLAGVLLFVTVTLAVICIDVITGGGLTRSVTEETP